MLLDSCYCQSNRKALVKKLELAEGLCISMGFPPDCGQNESEDDDYDDH